MRKHLHVLWTVLRAAVDRWLQIDGLRLGAGFSYYATFAIFPVSLLIVTAVGYVIGDEAPARERLMATLVGSASPLRPVLEQALLALQQSRSARGPAAVASFVMLLLGASGALVEVDYALNKIWGAPHPEAPDATDAGRARFFESLLRDRLTGFLLVLGVGLAILASLITSSLLELVGSRASAFGGSSIYRNLQSFASLSLLTVAFTFMFHFVPRARPPVSHVVWGAVATALFLTLLKGVFAGLLGRLTNYAAYGIVGGVLGLATWIYASSQVIFFGATIARANHEHRLRARPETPNATS